jgi:YVTN family beta-propeller protein
MLRHSFIAFIVTILSASSLTGTPTIYAEHLYSVIGTINFSNPYPSGVTINSPDAEVYVTLFDSSEISIINGQTDEIADTIFLPNGTYPDDIDFSIIDGGSYLYVIDRSSSSPHTLKVIDTSTKQVVANIPVGVNGNEVAANSANAKVYVASEDGVTGTADRVFVINGRSNTVITTVAVGSHPLGVTVNPASGRAYVANFESNTVSVIDGTSNNVIATIPVGQFPSAVDVDMYTNRIYVTNSGTDSVSVIDGISNNVISTIPVGNGPRAVDVNQFNHRVFVTNIFENTVSVIDGMSNTVIDAVSVGNEPWKVAVNAAKDKVYVTNRDSNTVSVISAETPEVCPTKNIQHWDKIVFKILSSDLAERLNLTAGTELDIKIQDDPSKVADIKQKVLDSLQVPDAPRNATEIIDVNYAIICASQAAEESESITMANSTTANLTKSSSLINITGLR